MQCAEFHYWILFIRQLSLSRKTLTKGDSSPISLNYVMIYSPFNLYEFLSFIYIYIYISGGPLSALTCCVNVRLLSAIKKNIAVNLFSKLGWELGLYYASYDDFHPDILARMYT